MIIPFIIDIASSEEAPWLYEFYEFVKMQTKQNYGVIIAQQEYCRPLSYFKGIARKEANNPLIVSQNPITEEDLSKVCLYCLPEDILDLIVSEFQDRSSAALFLIDNSCHSLAIWFSQTLDKIEADNNDKIEAIIMFRQYKSIDEIAVQRGIQVIYYDCGTFRTPAYYNTVYIDFSGFLHQTALKKRYEQFAKEQIDKRTILSGDEILALMIQLQNLSLLADYNTKPKFSCGVALQGNALDSMLPCPKSSNKSMLTLADSSFTKENISVRGCPGGITSKAFLDSYRLNNSKYSSQFITLCQTVVSRMSNMAYETMLWGRKSLSTEDGLYSFAGITTFNDKQNREGDAFLSFVAFGFYIPREWLYDMEYLRWRLTMPSETEIYLKHLEYAFKRHDIFMEDFLKFDKKRFDFLLQMRKIPPKGQLMCKLDTLAETDMIYSQVKEALIALCKLDTIKEFEALYSVVNELLNQNHVVTERNKELAHVYKDMQEMQSICRKLESLKAELEVKYEGLQREHTELEVKYEGLLQEHTELQNDCAALQDSRENLQQSHDALAQQFNSLTREHNQLTQYLKTNKMKAIIKLLLNKNII